MTVVSARHRLALGPPDPTHYPVEDDVGESVLQRLMIELLRPLVARWLETRDVTAFVGADQFIYWVQHEPTTNVAPDLYVLPGVDPGTSFDCWKVWETGIVPSFALEIVSRDAVKDYEIGPQRYDALGVRELVVLDPGAAGGRERVRWQVFRRRAPRGRLTRIEATNRDRVRSRELGCFLRVAGDGPQMRVRIASGARGERLYPTVEETLRAERAARTQAEAEVARLRADLEEARSSRRRRT